MEIIKFELDYEEFIEMRASILRTLSVYKKCIEDAIENKDESGIEYYFERKFDLECVLEKIDKEYKSFCDKIGDLPF